MGPFDKMATEEENIEIEEELPQEKGKKVAKHDSGAADLEKVTDYVEETEIAPQNIADAMRAVSDRQAKEAAEKQLLEKELSKIKILKEDVDLIVSWSGCVSTPWKQIDGPYSKWPQVFH